MSAHICDGCIVREPWEHRCHYDDGLRPCTCVECNTMACAKCGYRVATVRGALPFGWSFVEAMTYCNAHARHAVTSLQRKEPSS